MKKGSNEPTNNGTKIEKTDFIFDQESIEFEDALVEMKSADGFLPNPVQYIGEEDAAIEWNNDPTMAEKRFLYTDAYRSFSKHNSLILLGRTGTGKTSILRCMYEEIRQKNINIKPDSERLKEIENYDLAFMIQFKDILPYLAKDGVNFSSSTIIYELPQIIKMWVHTMMMLEIIKDNEPQTMLSAKKLSNIKEFLSKKGLYRDNHVVRDGVRMLLSITKEAKPLLLISDFIENLFDAGYEDALSEMYDFLKGKKTLVLVDTLNEYDLRDKTILLCTKALITTCFQFYEKAEDDRIWMKISLPSEIYTMLVDSLPGKQRHNTVIIQWSSKELIKMIAIRLLESQDKGYLKFESHFTYKNFYDTDPNAYDNAKKLIAELLPDKCPTSLWIGEQQGNRKTYFVFPTIHYCIRHTLKKPRELITIFNHLLTAIIEKEGGKQYFIEHPEKVKDYIHSTQEDLIGAALSMYETSYPEIHRICYTVLHNMEFVALGKEFEPNLRAAVAQVKASYNIREKYDKKEIQRILMESGLVGQLEESTIVRIKGMGQGDKSTIENSYRAVKASYEYQVKGRLEMNPDTKCVIHPMCYEHFRCKVRRQTIVFPDRFDQDDAIAVEVKSE